MITFKDFLAEIFDGKDIFAWKAIRKDVDMEIYKFNSFTVMITNNKLNPELKETQYTVDFLDESIPRFSDQFKPTGKRTPSETIKIYNTIGNIIKINIGPHMKRGDSLYFKANTSKTINIYDRFAKIIAKEIKGHYERPESTHFRITKK